MDHSRFQWTVDDLLVVELEVHSVVDFVVFESDVIFVDGVPLFQDDFVPPESKWKRKMCEDKNLASDSWRHCEIHTQSKRKSFLKTCCLWIQPQYLVPVCAAMSFLRSPTVSSSLHLTLTFLPSRSFTVISIILHAKALENPDEEKAEIFSETSEFFVVFQFFCDQKKTT